MPKISPLYLLPPAVFLVLTLVFVLGLGRENPNNLPSTMIGREAPAISITQLGDLPVFDHDDLLKPGVKIVNFWASWCAPCRVEHPNLMGLAAAGLPIYGVNYKDEPAAGLKFLSDLGDPYTGIGQDYQGRQAIEWGVYGVPETYVIDGKGKIVLRFPGPITQRVLNETILPAMKAAQAE